MPPMRAGRQPPVPATAMLNCILPAAGHGTRLQPATRALPKALLPVFDKPLIQYAAAEAMAARLTRLNVVYSSGQEAIRKYFKALAVPPRPQQPRASKIDPLQELHDIIRQCRIQYTRQHPVQGLGHAIIQATENLTDAPFAVLLPDELCPQPGILPYMVPLFVQHQCAIIAVANIPRQDTRRYGIIAGQDMGNGLYRVTGMVEKPEPAAAPSTLACIGRYVLTPDILDLLRHTEPDASGEIQLTSALNELAAAGRLLAMQYHGPRFDCGSHTGLLNAGNHMRQTQANPYLCPTAASNRELSRLLGETAEP